MDSKIDKNAYLLVLLLALGAQTLIVELTIGLGGKIGPGSDVAAHIAQADPTDPGCPGGVIDPVGNQ